jgi:two-component system chemotaxis response regulator CheY
MKVLVVDDSKTTRDMVSFTLRRAGYEMIEAVDGSSALSVLAGRPVDCVITDLNMPGKNGIDLIRDLRATPLYRTTPIVMLTTDSDQAKKEAGQKAGASHWLNKPFHPTSLVKLVGDLLPVPG